MSQVIPKATFRLQKTEARQVGDKEHLSEQTRKRFERKSAMKKDLTGLYVYTQREKSSIRTIPYPAFTIPETNAHLGSEP